MERDFLDVSVGHTVIRILDLETTGLKPAEGGVCELAAIDLVYSCDTNNFVWNNDLKKAKFFETLVNPGCPIPPEASGIHHLTDKDVAGAPTFLEALMQMQTALGPCQYYAAHNAPFDSDWVAYATKRPASEMPWLCTMKTSQELFGELENHQLGTLRYALKEPYYDDEEVIGLPHQAISDVRVAFLTMQRMLRQHTPEELLKMSVDPIVRNPAFRLSFTDFRGLRWSDEVPDTILWWISNKRTMDANKKLTAQHWLKYRQDKGFAVAGGWDDAERLLAEKAEKEKAKANWIP